MRSPESWAARIPANFCCGRHGRSWNGGIRCRRKERRNCENTGGAAAAVFWTSGVPQRTEAGNRCHFAGTGCAGDHAHWCRKIRVLSDFRHASAGADNRHFSADLSDERSGGGIASGGDSGGVPQQYHLARTVCRYDDRSAERTVPDSVCCTGAPDDGAFSCADSRGSGFHGGGG